MQCLAHVPGNAFMASEFRKVTAKIISLAINVNADSQRVRKRWSTATQFEHPMRSTNAQELKSEG
jgi:hypothetical protein